MVIHKENGGVSSARKEGLARANGEYISFVDSDDYLENDYFEKLANEIGENCPDIICCNCIDEGDVHQPNICITEDSCIETLSDKMECYFAGMRFAYVVWGKLYKKALISQIDMPSMRYTEDTYMILQAFKLSAKIVLLNYAGYHYRESYSVIRHNKPPIHLTHHLHWSRMFRMTQLPKNLSARNCRSKNAM